MTAIIPNYSTRPQGGSGGESHAKGHEIVIDDVEASIRRARDEGKLVLLNFTGYT